MLVMRAMFAEKERVQRFERESDEAFLAIERADAPAASA